MVPKTIERKLEEGRQYRRVIEMRATAENDGMFVEGYATTFDQPYELFRDGDYIVMEEVDSHAFDDCDRGDVIMQYDHIGRVFARTSNGTLATDVDAHGLHIRANLSGTEIGRQLYEEISGGYTDKMSFGFRIAEDSRTVTEDRESGIVTVLRRILRISKLYDVSAVSLPANNATEISARSFVDGVIAELSEESRKRKEIQRKKQKIRILTEV